MLRENNIFDAHLILVYVLFTFFYEFAFAGPKIVIHHFSRKKHWQLKIFNLSVKFDLILLIV
jgi:hypothetical protein